MKCLMEAGRGGGVRDAQKTRLKEIDDHRKASFVYWEILHAITHPRWCSFATRTRLADKGI